MSEARIDLDEVLKLTDPYLPKCPAVLQRQMLHEIMRDFFHDTQVWTIETEPITTDSDLDEYDVEIEYEDMAEIDRVLEVRLNGSAISAWNYLGNDMVRLETDSDGEELTMLVSLVPKPAATRILKDLYDRYAMIWKDGVLFKCYMMPFKPWSNPALGNVHYVAYEAAKSNVIGERNREFSNKSLRWRVRGVVI